MLERFDVSKKRLRTLHINPLQTDEFCISGTDTYDLNFRNSFFFLFKSFSCVKVWDLRNMSAMKYCLKTDYSCYGAYYNQAGSHIMVTTRNDHLQSFSYDDIQHANDPLEIEPTKRIHHINFFNRFVTPFTAQPYSTFESYFLIGSNRYPREVNFSILAFNNFFIYLFR